MGPLAGIKVIEIKGIGPGPYAGQILADLGAEVVVVERASKPNSIAPPSALDVNSRGKKSIALDLRKPQGLEALLKMVESADIIFEGNRPGVAEKLGFGPETCLERNARIIYGRVTGWGQYGLLAHSAGHDLNYISLTGAAAAVGTKDKPVPALNLIGDFAGGSMFLVIGILSALIEVQDSGKGQVVDAAITDGSAHLLSIFYTLKRIGAWQTGRESNLLDGGRPYYSVYETSDNKHISVAPIEPQFFASLVSIAGLPEEFIELQNDPASWSSMRATMTDVFRTRTRDEWADIFEGTDACVAAILDYEEAINHPHNVDRASYIEVDGQVQPAPAPRFSRTQCSIPEAPSHEGQDTLSVLADWGFDPGSIDLLEQSGALS